MENKYTHGVLFYHEHSGLKNINQGIGEVTTALSSICKHLSIQLSENEGDIIKYCQEIKTKNYAKDVDILFILGGDGTVNNSQTVLWHIIFNSLLAFTRRYF